MDKTIIAQAIAPIVNQADQAGELFAKSEIDAGLALELFARSVGTEPTYQQWVDNRTAWTDAYVRTKPQAKGESADGAFKRFKDRLADTYGINAPKSKGEGAIKKAQERAEKESKLMAKYEQTSTPVLKDLLSREYEIKAKNPTKKSAIMKELERVVMLRTKTENADTKAELKELRTQLAESAKNCEDPTLLQTAIDILGDNYDISVE
jgi:hypothetical protein